jgi:glycosyltransferase involved in cell wall biosynthesis
MKVLNVGSKSVHVHSFLQRMVSVDQYLFTEDKTFFLPDNKEFAFKIRSINFVQIIFNLIRIRKTIKKLNPDLIHIHQLNRFAFIVSLLTPSRIPIISTAWGSDVLIMPWKNRLFYYMTKYIINRSNIVTADAKDMINVLKRIENNDAKFVLLQYGIDYIEPVHKENIIYSNRLHTSLYRISNIIDYFREFTIKEDSWRLIIAGSGEGTEELKVQVEKNNLNSKVEFVGWLDKNQNHAYYAKSKVYISIPKSDGTSVSLLESMSAGCIPIVSDLEVSKEWVEHLENGIIEKKGENPFFLIHKLDLDNLIHKNRIILDSKNVSTQKSKEMFLTLYNKLLCQK